MRSTNGLLGVIVRRANFCSISWHLDLDILAVEDTPWYTGSEQCTVYGLRTVPQVFRMLWLNKHLHRPLQYGICISFLGLPNKGSTVGWLRTRGIYCPTVLEARSLRLYFGRVGSFWGLRGRIYSRPPSSAGSWPATRGILWLTVILPFAWRSPCVPVSVSKYLLSIRTWSYWTRAHPNDLVLTNYIWNDPVSHQGHILRCYGLGLQHTNLRWTLFYT